MKLHIKTNSKRRYYIRNYSGNSLLIYDGVNTHIAKAPYWQGTIVYFELHSNKEINPNDIVDNRTDCEGQFNDEFIKEDELDNLW